MADEPVVVEEAPEEVEAKRKEEEAKKEEELKGKSRDARKGHVVLPGVPEPGGDPEEKGKAGRREAFQIASQNPQSREFDDVRAQAKKDAEEAKEEAEKKAQGDDAGNRPPSGPNEGPAPAPGSVPTAPVQQPGAATPPQT